MTVFLIAGLGNPGKEYDDTRHNVGFWLLDALIKEYQLEWKYEKKLECSTATFSTEALRCYFVKPEMYMNNSGRCLRKVCDYLKIEPTQVVVVYDEINLPMGSVKLTVDGSAGGHNGVSDILQHFGKGFARYRIGIGGKMHQELTLTEHVLGKFTDPEKQVLTNQKRKYIQDLKLLLAKGIEEAMKDINKRSTNNNEQPQSI